MVKPRSVTANVFVPRLPAVYEDKSVTDWCSFKLVNDPSSDSALIWRLSRTHIKQEDKREGEPERLP